MLNKRITIILISILIMISFRFLPLNLSGDALAVLGVFVGSMILWLNIGIDVSSLITLLMLMTIESIGVKSVLNNSIGSNTIMFLMMTFIVSYGLAQTHYLKKLAFSFINSKVAQKGPWTFIMCFFLSVLISGLFISPTVLFMIFYPILNTIYEVLNLKKQDKLSGILMFGLIVCCGLSSGMTPIAHVFPLISMALVEKSLGISVSYLSYMSFGMVVGILAFVIMMVFFKYILRVDVSKLTNPKIFKLDLKDYAYFKRDRMILRIFILVCVIWLFPVLLKGFTSGRLYHLLQYLDKNGQVIAPLLGSILMFVFEVDCKPLINFKEAFSQGILWQSIIMCSATLALGAALINKDLGITTYLKDNLILVLSNLEPLLLIFVFILWTNIQTNLSSNLVTANLVTSVALVLLGNNSLGINLAALCVLIGMNASFAFASAPAMPCVSIAIASGYIDTKRTLKYGCFMAMVCILLSVSIGYFIASRIL